MSELETRLNNDYQEALKSKNQEQVATLRLVKTALQNEAIKQKTEHKEEEVLKVLKKEAKKRLEAIETYTQGNRDDLKSREEVELKIIKEYLPPEISEEQLTDLVKKVLSENDLTSQQNFGQAMKLVLAEVKGQADGARVSQIVKELLSQ